MIETRRFGLPNGSSAATRLLERVKSMDEKYALLEQRIARIEKGIIPQGSDTVETKQTPKKRQRGAENAEV